MKNISKIITAFLFSATIFQAHAQVGSMMLYGSLNYHSSKDGGYEFKANPFGVGYTFNNAVVAGVNFAFDHERDGNNSLVANKFEVGPFYSYAWPVGKHFMIIAQVDTHYQWGQSDLGGRVNSPVDYNGYLVRVYPIADVILGKGWAFKAKFGEISFSHMRGKDTANTIAQDFVAGVNGSTIGIGVSKNFMLKRKHQ